MRRKAPLPDFLVPWFELGEDGAVRCRKCPATFIGTQTDDLTLARHAAEHIAPKPITNIVPPQTTTTS